LKKLGKESLSDNATKAEQDFFEAIEHTDEFVKYLDDLGLDKGAALGGALTHLMSRLIRMSPDSTTALGLLSFCMQNAGFHAGDLISQKIIHPGSASVQ
jgi:hypothetical protein